jgi:hypothetical protein
MLKMWEITYNTYKVKVVSLQDYKVVARRAKVKEEAQLLTRVEDVILIMSISMSFVLS